MNLHFCILGTTFEFRLETKLIYYEKLINSTFDIISVSKADGSELHGLISLNCR